MFLHEEYLFDVVELLDIYETELEPYLGYMKLYVDKERCIMGELAYIANWELAVDEPILTKVLSEMFIPTDIFNHFLSKYNRCITRLVDHINTNIDYILLNPGDTTKQFNANITFYPGYLVILSATLYR